MTEKIIPKEEWLGFELRVQESKVLQIKGQELLENLEFLVTSMEEDDQHWEKRWSMGSFGQPASWVRKHFFRGSNWLGHIFSRFDSPWYFTFKDIEKLGATIKEDQRKKAVAIVFFPPPKIIKKKDSNGNETNEEIYIPRMPRFTAEWNFEQLEFTDEVLQRIEASTSKPKTFEHSPIDIAEKLIELYPDPPKMVHKSQSNRNCYSVLTDEVRVLERERFETAEDYYATVIHELAHATGHESRLNRKSLKEFAIFKDKNYCYEELVAETAQFMVMSFLGLHAETMFNSAAYLRGWLQRLQGEPTIFVKAMEDARRAAEYMLKPVIDVAAAFGDAEPEYEEIQRDAKSRAKKKASKKTSKKSKKKTKKKTTSKKTSKKVANKSAA
jgi:antirestriction protein ArdC